MKDRLRVFARPAERAVHCHCRSAVIVAALFLLALAFRAPAAAEAEEVPNPEIYQSFLTRVVAQLLSSQHYSGQELDDDIAVQIYQEYLQTLDPNRRYFLASDVDEFGRERTEIDDYLQKGNLDLTFDIYERLLQRVEERVEYSRERLAEPFDFTIEEEVVVEREDADWCQTRDELDELWRKLLKNRVLSFVLMDEAEAAAEEDKQHDASAEDEPAPGDEEAEPDDTEAGAADAAEPENGADGENGEGDEATAAEFVDFEQLTPEERVLRAQERYLHYLRENDSIDILELYLTAVAKVYDPHSIYMAPSTQEDFDINMSLSLEGIGAVLTTEHGYVKIVSIVPGGPAARNGTLQEGDRIIAVTQEEGRPVDVIDMPLRKVVELIRGPKGTEVRLTVLEAEKGVSGVPVGITLTRDEVKLKAQEARAEFRHPVFTPAAPDEEEAGDATPAACVGGAVSDRNGNYMVITLPSFYSDFKGRKNGDKEYKSSSRDVRRLLEDARAQEVDGVILDLRSNGGGSLEEAIKVAGLFFDTGPVVQVRDSRGKTKVYRDTDEGAVYEGPLLILVNRLSASASEIVAAAIKDHHRGILVGEESTHGKGTVQTVLELDRFFRGVPLFQDEQAGSLKFTIAKFYRVNGESTQRRGVTPDVVFPSFTDHMDLGEANLDHALIWDTIDALETNSEVDIRQFLPMIKECSEARRAHDPAYRKMLDTVAKFAELRARKTVPLSRQGRKEMRDTEEDLLDKVRSYTVRRQPYGGEDSEDEDDGDDEEEEKTDLMLEEALRIISDLAWLQKGELMASPPQEPAEAEGDAPPAAGTGE